MIKTPFTYCLFLLLAVISCSSETAQTPEEPADKKTVARSTVRAFKQTLLKQQIDSLFSKTNFNGSISIMQNGVKLYEKQNGFEDFKTKKELDSRSVFAVGSVSKQFAAVMLLTLEDQGKLNTNDKVSRFLPEFKDKPFEDITVHQLLNHTSGISDLGPGLQSGPGVEFNYSNKGYRHLGEIIEKASGKSFDENAEQLFAKAGMQNSFTATNFKGNRLAGAHTGTPANFEVIEQMPARLAHPSISAAAGGILSTATDLHRWNEALFGGKILKAESLKKLMTATSGMKHPVLGKVGYGYGIMMSEKAPASYFHSGYVKGSPSLNIYYPKTKTSVVILSNIADLNRDKNEIFHPHKEVKKVMDVLENVSLNFKNP